MTEDGDVVVQSGTTHAWRNPGPELAVLHAIQFATGSAPGTGPGAD